MSTVVGLGEKSFISSTYWQAKDVVFRRKGKAEFLGVMADFLQGDRWRETDIIPKPPVMCFKSASFHFRKSFLSCECWILSPDLFVNEPEGIFQRGILERDGWPLPSTCRTSQEEVKHGERHHRRGDQHWDVLHGRDQHRVNRSNVNQTSSLRSNRSKDKPTAKREAKKFFLTSVCSIV